MLINYRTRGIALDKFEVCFCSLKETWSWDLLPIYMPTPPPLTLSVNIEKLVERKFFSVATNLKLSNTLALHWLLWSHSLQWSLWSPWSHWKQLYTLEDHSDHTYCNDNMDHILAGMTLNKMIRHSHGSHWPEKLRVSALSSSWYMFKEGLRDEREGGS